MNSVFQSSESMGQQKAKTHLRCVGISMKEIWRKSI